MHLTHRNLVGVTLRAVASVDAFVGEHGRLLLTLENAADTRAPRPRLRGRRQRARRRGRAGTRHGARRCRAVARAPRPPGRGSHQAVHGISVRPVSRLDVRAPARHVCSPGRCRADAAKRRPRPRAAAARTAVHRVGDEEWAGLREFRSGDSPRQVAWGAYARGRGLAGEDLSIAGRAPAPVRPRGGAGRNSSSASNNCRRGSSRRTRAASATACASPGTALPPGQRQRTSRALPQRARAVWHVGEAMVNAAARSHIAATLVFVASVLLVATDAPAWCVAIALAAAHVALARGRRTTARRRSASPACASCSAPSPRCW